jgi:hypothetical protein
MVFAREGISLLLGPAWFLAAAAISPLDPRRGRLLVVTHKVDRRRCRSLSPPLRVVVVVVVVVPLVELVEEEDLLLERPPVDDRRLPQVVPPEEEALRTLLVSPRRMCFFNCWVEMLDKRDSRDSMLTWVVVGVVLVGERIAGVVAVLLVGVRIAGVGVVV